jgi:adenylate cyclase
VTLTDAAQRIGVTPATLRRWIRQGLISQYDGAWTLAGEARIIKTIGDEVMIIGPDGAALTDWAVGFQTMQTERPLPRIAVHCGVALFRDGDCYGRDINIASRVSARSAGGEVLVIRPVVEVAGSHLEFERIGEVTLKGFSESTGVFVARRDQEETE